MVSVMCGDSPIGLYSETYEGTEAALLRTIGRKSCQLITITVLPDERLNRLSLHRQSTRTPLTTKHRADRQDATAEKLRRCNNPNRALLLTLCVRLCLSSRI
jgi:hypothetical protein